MLLNHLTVRRCAAWLVVVMLLVLSLPLTIFAAPNAQQSGQAVFPLDVRDDPVMMIASYYNAINLGDYARAYGYWENPPKGATLAQFAAGYNDTADSAAFVRLPVMMSAGAGNIFAQVPVLLAADHTDGSEHYFVGCFTVHKTNVPVGSATEPDPNWYLNSATMREVATFDLALLDGACPQTPSLEAGPQNLTSPVSLLATYYEALANGDYARAYGYWENPPNPTLQDFAQGFANTRDISVIVRLDIFMEGAAGSTYASVPALVTATLNNGTNQYFTGCFTARRVNVPQGNEGTIDPDWRLYDAALLERGSLESDITLLEGACGA